MTVLCPASFAELRAMLRRALFEMTGPVAVRYPRGGEGAFTADTSARGLAELRTGKDITLLRLRHADQSACSARRSCWHEDGIAGAGGQAQPRLRRFRRRRDLPGRSARTKRLVVAEESLGRAAASVSASRRVLAEAGHESQRLMLLQPRAQILSPQGSVGAAVPQMLGLDAREPCRHGKGGLPMSTKERLDVALV